jgi:HK97 family phage prohead protease
MKKENKSLEFKIDKIENKQDGGLIWNGYVAAYNNIDSYGDVIVKGAFDSVIGKTIPAFYEHKYHVGKLNVVNEDLHGLKVSGELMPDELQDPSVGKLSAKIRWMMENDGVGSLPFKMSIGYITKNFENSKQDGKNVRVLKEIDLVEGSIVLQPANKNAIITDWKSGDYLTMESIDSISEREIESALKSGVKVSGNLAKYFVSCLKGRKNSLQKDEDSILEYGIDLKAINEKLDSILKG